MGYKLIVIGLFFVILSCKKDDNNSNSLNGVWLLQDISTGAKLTFSGNNFTINSGTVTIEGTYELNGNIMRGKATSRQGAGSSLLQPDSFTGNVDINGNRATFTNFSGNWVVFSSWYQKQ